MYKKDQEADSDNTVWCANTSCGRPYRAVKLVPTISTPENLGKVFCPHCGCSTEADRRFVWFGLRC